MLLGLNYKYIYGWPKLEIGIAYFKEELEKLNKPPEPKNCLIVNKVTGRVMSLYLMTKTDAKNRLKEAELTPDNVVEELK